MTEKHEKKIGELQVRIKGKLHEVERFDGQKGPIFENLIVIPAIDTMHSPMRIVVKSIAQIAQIDAMVDVIADLKSRYWRRSKDGKANYSAELWLAEN